MKARQREELLGTLKARFESREDRRSPMICRIWHGWTTRANAHQYEALLRNEIFAGIAARQMAGFRGIDLLRHDGPDEVEFVTVMWFDSLQSVREFAGPDYEVAMVPPEARRLLERFDERSAHYDVVERRSV